MATIPITKGWLQKTYLFGIDLTDDVGNPYPDMLYDHAINSAVATLCSECDLQLYPETVTERHDFDVACRGDYPMIMTDRRPVQSGSVSMRFMLADAKVMDVPPEWVQEFAPGEIEIMPVAFGSASLYPMTGRGDIFGMIMLARSGRIPGYFEATYTAGFPEGDMVLLNDLVRDATVVYNAHRVDITGSPTVHGTPDATNTLVAHGGDHVYAGRTEAEAIVQANALRAAYEAHRILVGGGLVHGSADAVNVLTAPVATDLATLVALLNDLRTMIGCHLLEIGGVPTCHGQADDVRAIVADVVRADYIALPDVGTIDQVPIRHALGMLAAIPILDIAGDLVIGVGIASMSKSIDALSQSVATTSSAENSAFSARIKERYLKDLEGRTEGKPGVIAKIKAFYHGSLNLEVM